jgi:biopolymer transport protein ExbB/TolQ
MINSDSMPPSATTDTLFDLLKLIADPKGASKRLSELLQACQDANAATTAWSRREEAVALRETTVAQREQAAEERHQDLHRRLNLLKQAASPAE